MARLKVEKPTAHIDQWVLERDATGFYLTGVVSNHQRQDDFKAERQRTSRVVLFDGDNNAAETLNTRYTLGAQLVVAE